MGKEILVVKTSTLLGLSVMCRHFLTELYFFKIPACFETTHNDGVIAKTEPT